MPSETRDLIESTMDAMRKDGFEFHRQRRMALGQMVEVLCAEYLASQT